MKFVTIMMLMNSAVAFIPKSSTSFLRKDNRITLCASSASPEGVKKAGGGIALMDAGDRQSLFDPAIEGKLGGTGILDTRIQQGPNYTPITPEQEKQGEVFLQQEFNSMGTTTPATQQSAEHWLEDIGLPLNFAKPNTPVTATVLGRTKLITDDAPGDIQHVLLQLPKGMHYVEGQSLTVIPPGADAKTGKPYKPRLYSIASTRYGDLLDGETISLCVRRAEYKDPITGITDPSKKGICSNFLCDAQPGTTVQVAGPTGKTMLLPEDDLSKDIIMVATGTGIAPFRGFLHRLFMEQTVARHMYTGKAWLILGVPVTGGLLYHDELMAMQRNANRAGSGEFEVTYAISREMFNAQGGKLYVQDVLTDRADELFQRLENGAHIYFCGLKGMMPGILEALEQVASSRGMDWSTKLKQYQANKQWHVEVY